MSTVPQICIPQPTQILFATLNRIQNQEKPTQSSIEKQIKKISNMIIFTKLAEITDEVYTRVKSTFDLIYRNITMYFFEDVDQKKMEVVSTPLSKFMLTLNCEQDKQMLLIDNYTLFNSMSYFDLHYLTQVFKQGFIFIVSNKDDSSRMIDNMHQFAKLNATEIVTNNREQFMKKNKTRVVDMPKFLAFYDNYGSTYNKFFILIFSSINDLNLVESFISNDINVKYFQKLTLELNQYRSRFLNDIPSFISSLVLPILNIELEKTGKKLSISTIFGFDKLLDLYIEKRHLLDITEFCDEDGMQFVLNLITIMYENIISTRKVVKMPKQAFSILLIWYKKMKKDKSIKLFNFLQVVHNVDKDITKENDETAVCKIFCIQSVDTFNAKKKKLIDMTGYIKFQTKHSILTNGDDIILKDLGQLSATRIHSHIFERNYSEKELNSTFAMSSTKIIKDDVTITETYPTNVNSSSSEEDLQIKTANSMNVDDDSSDSDSDPDNYYISLLRKKKAKKLERDASISTKSNSSVKSTLSQRKYDLDSDTDEEAEKNKVSDLSTTNSSDEEQYNSEKDKSKEIDQEQLSDLTCKENDDNKTLNQDIKIKGIVKHNGSCFYGSVALHINEDVETVMSELKEKLADQTFIKQVDNLLEDNKCPTLLTGNEHIVLQTLIPDSNNCYVYATNLCFAATSISIQRNIVVIVGTNMYLDQTSRFSETLYIHGDGVYAFDPIENIDISLYKRLNWDGLEVTIDDDDDVDTENEVLNVTDDSRPEFPKKNDDTSDDEQELLEKEKDLTDEISNDIDLANEKLSPLSKEEEKEERNEISYDETSELNEQFEIKNDGDEQNEYSQTDSKEEEKQEDTSVQSDETETSDDDKPRVLAAKAIEEQMLLIENRSSNISLDAVQKLTEENKQIADEMLLLMSQHDNIRNEKDELTAKVENFEHSITDMRKTIKEQYDRINQLQRESVLQKDLFNKDLATKDEEINKLNMDVQTKELKRIEALEQLEQQTRELKNKISIIAAQDKRLDDKERYITQLHSDKGKLLEEKREVQRELSESKDVSKNLQKENNSLNSSINSLNLKLDQAEKQIDVLTKAAEDKSMCDEELVKSNERNKVLLEQISELKDQAKLKDEKIINIGKELKDKNLKLVELQKQNDELENKKKLDKNSYIKPEQFEKHNQYEGTMYDHIMTQVKLYNEKEAKMIPLTKYFQICDTSLIFGPNVDENCLILYSNHFESNINITHGNFVIVNKRCPCGNHKAVDDWISQGYVIDNRYNITLSTSYVCSCMMKPASIDDLLLFSSTYPIFKHSVSNLMSRYM